MVGYACRGPSVGWHPVYCSACGLVAWALAMAVFTIGGPGWLVMVGLALSGACVSCFRVAGQVFVDGRAQGDVRASVQGLLCFINGAALLSGSLLVGLVWGAM